MQEVLSQLMIPFGLQSCQNEVLLKRKIYFLLFLFFWKGGGGGGLYISCFDLFVWETSHQ